MKKKMDHRFYPQGRKRVYLSPAHMDIHCGDNGFYVEELNGSYTLGYYDRQLGLDSSRVVTRDIFRSMKALSGKAAKQFGESCGNVICENALKQRMERK